MCVLALAWKSHPRWQLVLAGNRDEFHARPAAALARWDDPSGIIAGRDLQSGGTWLGVSDMGRLVVVTNLRGHGGPDPEKASRGALVAGLLTGDGPYADPATAPLQDFNPFNLIRADGQGATFLSNRPGDIRTSLSHGVYGLSNGALDEPWPKTLQIKSGLTDWLAQDSGDIEQLFALLRTEGQPHIGIAPATPSEVTQEPALSTIFIHNPVYGTRCSTVVTVDAQGQGQIAERRYDATGTVTGETRIDFHWR